MLHVSHETVLAYTSKIIKNVFERGENLQ